MSDRIAAVVWNATRSGGSVVPLLPKPEPTGGGVKEVWKFPKGVAVGVGVGDGAAVGGTACSLMALVALSGLRETFARDLDFTEA